MRETLQKATKEKNQRIPEGDRRLTHSTRTRTRYWQVCVVETSVGCPGLQHPPVLRGRGEEAQKQGRTDKTCGIYLKYESMRHLAVIAVVPGSGAGRWSVGCGAAGVVEVRVLLASL